MMDGPTSGRDVRTSAVPFVYLSTLISMCYKIYLPVLLTDFLDMLFLCRLPYVSTFKDVMYECTLFVYNQTNAYSLRCRVLFLITYKSNACKNSLCQDNIANDDRHG